ncbi:hypothetical protein [Streptomyces sp. STR69]|uniref:DUF6197 family protein n=1 Tax=Streptomyces sp. STR69 TaxID=1796942 RepID=UPI0021CA36B0|nr:hypothetical protein [Streptomyces sp. STR69]
MSTTALAGASRAPQPAVETLIDVDGLVVEIERYLAARTRTTAHPLVTKTTQELIDEALRGLASAPAANGSPQLAPPPAFLRRLPDWALSIPLVRNRFGAGGRQMNTAEHLELTALVIERWGWAKDGDRGERGEVCIRGAQFVLLRLGYGDADTLHRASTHLHQVLARGCGGSFVAWNDAPGRTKQQVLTLLRTAAAEARRGRSTI